MKENVEQLKKIVEEMHRCTAKFAKIVPVSETFQEQSVWQGTVYIFDIKGHPSANKCYAWSSPIEGSTKRRYYAVLHVTPIDSPEKAVRASIVQDHKTGDI